MKLTAQGFAVLEQDCDYSRRVEVAGTLRVDGQTLDAILPLIRPGMTIVDGGAFIGDHTASYLEAVGPTGAVWAFEPACWALECLRHNCPAAIIKGVALGEHSGLCHVVDHVNAAQTFVCDHERFMTPPSSSRPAAVEPLDAFDLAPDLIKLDLQGCEVRALRGATATIARSHPVLVVECHAAELARMRSSPAELVGLLTSLNYDVRPLLAWQQWDDPKLDLLALPRRR